MALEGSEARLASHVAATPRGPPRATPRAASSPQSRRRVCGHPVAMDDGVVILAALSDGTVILAAGALLAAGLGASLVAGRIRVPALVLFLGDRDGARQRRPRPDRVRRLRARALPRHRRRSSLILFEGGLATGWKVVRPVLGPVGVAGARRHARDGDDHRARGRLAARPVDARGPAARLDPLRDRRRGGLRRAARLDAAPAPGARARGRGGLQRPGRGTARRRLHRVDPGARLRDRRHGDSCSCRRWGSASPIGALAGTARGRRAAPRRACERRALSRC